MKRTYVSRPILKHLLKQITGQAWTFQEFVEGGKRVVICHPVNPEQCRAFMDWLWERGLNRKWRSNTDAALSIMAAWTLHTQERTGARRDGGLAMTHPATQDATQAKGEGMGATLARMPPPFEKVLPQHNFDKTR